VPRHEDTSRGGDRSELRLVRPQPAGDAERVVPVFEELPVFEEQDLPPARPAPWACAVMDKTTPCGAEISLLASRLLSLGRDRRLRRLGVVSALRGDGRTTVALGLARALADGERRALLLELDLLHPAADSALALPPPDIGLARYLGDDRVSVVPVRRPGRAGLWVLSAGAHGPTAANELSSPRLTPLLDAAARVFDYVVLDCPALLPGARGAHLQDVVDGLVLVVRERHTTRDALRQASHLLRPDRICGYVLNGRRGQRRARRRAGKA